MDIAEKHGNTTIHYNESCIDANLEKGIVYLQNNITGNKTEAKANLIFVADGTFSAIRCNAMQKLERFDYSQQYIPDGYRELLLPANMDGSHKLDKGALHIWPRGRFMLIALPNADGSFTCTLFMPFDEGEYSFNNLKTDEQVDSFFKSTFPDFHKLMPNVVKNWKHHRLSSLAIIRCYPWTHGKVALMGDAAHATVPFYGQGMNAGFEDCSVMWELMQKHGNNWSVIFEKYQQLRKPNGDAVQDLSLQNYYVMRDYVSNPMYLLQKKIEARFYEKHPDKWMPLYSQVSFSHIPYVEAIAIGEKQDKIMKKVMQHPNIKTIWDSNQIEQVIINEL